MRPRLTTRNAIRAIGRSQAMSHVRMAEPIGILATR